MWPYGACVGVMSSAWVSVGVPTTMFDCRIYVLVGFVDAAEKAHNGRGTLYSSTT